VAAALAVIVLAGVAVLVPWWTGHEATVRTSGGASTVTRAQLLDVADLTAVWPGPWQVVRTARPEAFDRPLVGCGRASSPVDRPGTGWARWSLHAPPDSDGPGFTELVHPAGSSAAAGAAVAQVRTWLAECPTRVVDGQQSATVLRDLPRDHGFLAQVHRVTSDYETYEQMAVGRVGDVVVVVSYGEYPGTPGHVAPDPARVEEVFHRAVDKLG
jgi:hypothetical protein